MPVFAKGTTTPGTFSIAGLLSPPVSSARTSTPGLHHESVHFPRDGRETTADILLSVDRGMPRTRGMAREMRRDRIGRWVYMLALVWVTAGGRGGGGGGVDRD